MGLIEEAIQKSDEEEKKNQIKKCIEPFVIEGMSIKDVVERFLEQQPFYYSKEKMWWLWKFEECKWVLTDEVDLMNALDDIWKENTLQPYLKSQYIEALKRRGRRNEPSPAKETWVQFKEKIIDTETGEEFKANPEYFITNPIPWKVGNIEDTQTIDRIFEEWVGEKWVPTLYEICSYCVLSSYPLGLCFCLNGTGLNGKTSFERLIKKFIGGSNVTSSKLNLLLSSRFESSSLYRKSVCLMGETNFSVLKDTDVFKQLTGQDLMRFEFKGKDIITGLNYAKLIIATNRLPESYDKTDGFYRRWLIIDFPNQFSEKKDIIVEIPDEEFENLARKSIKILKELLARGEFTNQGSVSERLRRYEERSNPLNTFIEDYCEEENYADNFREPFWKFYQEFIAFSETRNFRQQSKNEVGKSLRKRGFTITSPIPTGKTNEAGKPTSCIWIEGIRLKTEKIYY